jgi:hypothetical protein
MAREVARGILLLLTLLTPFVANADEWIPLPGSEHYEIDPASRQQGQRTDSKATVEAIWVRYGSVAPWQLWIDCGFRQSQSFGEPPMTGLWGSWKPIPPETYEWQVWEYLCKAHKAKIPKPQS